MNKTSQSSYIIGAVLLLLIVATRTQHFGSSVYLPDATLAALFLGGLLIAPTRWLALAIAVAFGMDAYALGWKGVSDYCMSFGYWGLIPTYAVVWGFGRWLAGSKKSMALLPYAFLGWAASSIAFVLSNAFWYSFSDKVASLTILEFVERVAKYYTPYVGYALMYLGIAWVVLRFLNIRVTAAQANRA